MLTLHSAHGNRPFGSWSEHDYEVVCEGPLSGRIFKPSPCGSRSPFAGEDKGAFTALPVVCTPRRYTGALWEMGTGAIPLTCGGKQKNAFGALNIPNQAGARTLTQQTKFSSLPSHS